MRIAIAHYSSKNDISGVTTWVINLIKKLVASNHEVFLYLLHFGSNPNEASILKNLEETGIEIESGTRKNNVIDIFAVLKWLNFIKPDIFLPQCLHSNYIAASIAGKQGLPWIFTFHSDDPEYWVISDLLNPLSNNALTVCVSKYLKKRLDPENNKLNIRFIPYGVVNSSFKVKYHPEKLTIVYLGRLIEEQKRITTVIKTLIRVCSKCDDVNAVVIGDGVDKSLCIDLVNQSSCSSRIDFVGSKNKIEIDLILQNSHIIILMSDYEGLPISLLEAMSFGVVPVVRDIESGIPELVENGITGFLVENEIDKAANLILELIHNQNIWEAVSMNAKQLISRDYDLDNTMKYMEETIDDHSRISLPRYPLKYIGEFHKKIYDDSRYQMYRSRNVLNSLKMFIIRIVCEFYLKGIPFK